MTTTREQAVQWAKQAWDDTGEGWTDGRWFDERAPSFEAFATLARADLEAELESLRKDAERYRWLCEFRTWPSAVEAAIDCANKALIDEAIDAAISAPQKEVA